jgi:hypothetical protein
MVVLVEWPAHRVSDLRHYLGLFAAPVIWWVQEALFSAVEVPSFLHFQLRCWFILRPHDQSSLSLVLPRFQCPSRCRHHWGRALVASSARLVRWVLRSQVSFGLRSLLKFWLCSLSIWWNIYKTVSIFCLWIIVDWIWSILELMDKKLEFFLVPIVFTRRFSERVRNVFGEIPKRTWADFWSNSYRQSHTYSYQHRFMYLLRLLTRFWGSIAFL